MARVTDVPIRPAATIVVLRDAAGGIEVFMVRRNFSIAFMAGAHVFPGGRVDAGDEGADPAWCDLPRDEESGRGPSLAFRVAALRELFEEAGVLMARAPDGTWMSADDPGAAQRVAHDRDAVHAGHASFRSIVEREGVRLALDAVVPFAHWVTPPVEVRRFDTWFFAVRAPARQVATHGIQESSASGWFTPRAALEACRRGRINLPPPTWATLRQLEPFATTADVLAWAAAVDLPARQPEVRHVDGAREIILPFEPTREAGSAGRFERRFVWVDGRWLPGEGLD